MPRTKFKMGQVGLELKKSLLLKHLGELEKLGREWLRELNAPRPFADSSTSMDPSSAGYKPAVERDEEANHMLRRHFRSRQLWKTHAEWGEKHRAIARLRIGIQEQFGPVRTRGGTTHSFLDTALEDAFDQILEGKISFGYELVDLGTSVMHRARTIVKSDLPPKLDSVETRHKKLRQEVAASKEMRQVKDMWSEASGLEESMTGLVRTALRASDLMYPCRYCRHLWKD